MARSTIRKRASSEKRKLQNIDTVRVGDVEELPLADNSVDLVFTSPPYEDARLPAGKLKGEDWVEWAYIRYLECVRVCRGLTAWVVDGRTQNFRWSATPAMLMADLKRSMDMKSMGANLRKPPIYHRVGIPGSGGKDWWRNDYEHIICASKGKLPWSDPLAIAEPPKYGPGGPPSHRKQDGNRVGCQSTDRRPSGARKPRQYKPPEKSNPGNVRDCGAVGGNNLGSKIAHENEAPFPLALAEAFVQCFCPPGGVVLDPMCGSGTVAHAAIKHGRHFICFDNRESQVELTKRRIKEAEEAEL